ncbi:MAG: hypothetical protein GY861_26460 [bacterium]|nr:hypothetical protein [bacterium]
MSTECEICGESENYCETCDICRDCLEKGHEIEIQYVQGEHKKNIEQLQVAFSIGD